MASSPLLALPDTAATLDRVERALRTAVLTDDDLLTEMASHLIVAGGKRLRPLVCAVSAAAGGAEVTDDVIMGGVSVELVHLGSLYHDDVIDEAETRRTVPSVNARWGNLKAVLAGDFLLARASEIAASLGTEVAGLLAHTIARLCEGEVGQLRTLYSASRSIDQYFGAIDGKTASLFSAAARIGGIVAGLDRSVIEDVTRYGSAFGITFQLVDDILDLTATEAELGKPVGHDLVEGVYTLPVINTLADGGTAAAELGDLLGAPLEPVELEKALAIVRSGAGVTAAAATAREWADKAAATLGRLPDSPTRTAMMEAPHALIDALRI
ncbi:MAG: polyprenyl synthetase family protein [Acidimicrobiia bacterium]